MSHDNEYDVNLRYGVDTDLSLSDKVAVVTGGLGGIAMASNQMLLEKGARLALLYPAFERDKAAQAAERFDPARVLPVAAARLSTSPRRRRRSPSTTMSLTPPPRPGCWA
ncbi:hypothetical protein MRO96_19100 [Dickeya dianthicola]|nr:hypothetical protein [Dickeya dianthicola]MCI4179202.1 hypothetical protein [Dickeya dianthicola]MCI4183214.1 hypothetical protein [Dickeya dianthicola]MCI4195355.1 hypothetical protein [Dickeya dianthicola]MCI4222090.1 hypothetical protein [Dickeya dianthicola]